MSGNFTLPIQPEPAAVGIKDISWMCTDTGMAESQRKEKANPLDSTTVLFVCLKYFETGFFCVAPAILKFAL